MPIAEFPETSVSTRKSAEMLASFSGKITTGSLGSSASPSGCTQLRFFLFFTSWSCFLFSSQTIRQQHRQITQSPPATIPMITAIEMLPPVSSQRSPQQFPQLRDLLELLLLLDEPPRLSRRLIALLLLDQNHELSCSSSSALSSS